MDDSRGAKRGVPEENRDEDSRKTVPVAHADVVAAILDHVEQAGRKIDFEGFMVTCPECGKPALRCTLPELTRDPTESVSTYAARCTTPGCPVEASGIVRVPGN